MVIVNMIVDVCFVIFTLVFILGLIKYRRSEKSLDNKKALVSYWKWLLLGKFIKDIGKSAVLIFF